MRPAAMRAAFFCSTIRFFVGHPIATSQARSVVPCDFENAAGFRGLEGAAGPIRD
jgi:hypothetical protein